MISRKYQLSRVRHYAFKLILLPIIVVFIPITLSACVPNLGTKSKAPSAGEFVKGAVIKGFPSDLPLYDKAQTVESYGSKDAFGASFIADADLAKVVNFYNASLPKLGWQSVLSQRSQTNYVFDIKNDTLAGSVIVNVASDGKKTAITMAIAAR